MSPTIFFVLEIFILYFVPIFGMGYNPSLLGYRPYLFLLGGIYVLWRGISRHVTLSDWGITTKAWHYGWTHLVSTTILLPLVAFLLLYFSSPELQVWLIGFDMLSVSLPMRLILYTFVSVPIQEFIFRSYLTWRMDQLGYNTKLNIAVSSLLFVAGHIPFRSPIMLGVVIVIGYVYSRLYVHHRNIFPILISHALVGSLLILIRNYFLPY
ncbi:CPBP family intramembrane metalloprotease [Candidatus Woesebacteria bacterium]|nr:CPBP family intramembrane metalloprotease [Candidatus Woesebacteria bacterium]